MYRVPPLLCPTGGRWGVHALSYGREALLLNGNQGGAVADLGFHSLPHTFEKLDLILPVCQESCLLTEVWG